MSDSKFVTVKVGKGAIVIDGTTFQPGEVAVILKEQAEAAAAYVEVLSEAKPVEEKPDEAVPAEGSEAKPEESQPVDASTSNEEEKSASDSAASEEQPAEAPAEGSEKSEPASKS